MRDLYLLKTLSLNHLSSESETHLVVEQQLSFVLREASGDGRGSGGAEPLLVDGDIERSKVTDPASPSCAIAATVVGRSGEEDGDRRVGELVEKRGRLAGDDVVLESVECSG